MLKEKLLEYLKNYEQDGHQLVIKWNTGGDETIINFYMDDESYPAYLDDIYSAFTSYLIEEFELPNAGEYYNNGGGVLSVEQGNRILFEYDEYAYGEIYDEDTESQNNIDAFNIPATDQSRQLLDYFNENELLFHGSTCFLNEVTDEFRVYTKDFDKKVKKERALDLFQIIKKSAIEKFTPPHDASEIHYSGILIENEIRFEDVYQLNYFLDKNKVKEKKYLFE